MKTHKELYPEQYRHSLVGVKVQANGDTGPCGTVERVVSTRFGLLAIFEGDTDKAYAVDRCVPISEQTADAEIDKLIDQYAAYCKSEGLPHLSADELVMQDGLTMGQREWLNNFLNEWERIAQG